MKLFLKIGRIGLLGSAMLLVGKPLEAGAVVIQPPVIAIQNAAVGINNPVTLLGTTNLSSPNWQALGVFSGSTNLAFPSLPAFFVRGVCSNPTVSITFAWPASTDSNVVGYKLYYGGASGTYTNMLDVGSATTATVSNLLAGTRYYFATTAYNALNVESPFSNETNGAFQAGFSLAMAKMGGGTALLTVTQTVAYVIAVPPPVVITKTVSTGITNPVTLQFTTNLSSPTWQSLGTFSGSTNLFFTNLPAVFIRGICSNLTASVTLAWQPSADTTVVGYKLHYGVASHTYTNAVNVGQATMATVSNLTPGTTYYFAVTAYGASGVESLYSNEASGTFQSSFSLAIGSP